MHIRERTKQAAAAAQPTASLTFTEISLLISRLYFEPIQSTRAEPNEGPLNTDN